MIQWIDRLVVIRVISSYYVYIYVCVCMNVCLFLCVIKYLNIFMKEKVSLNTMNLIYYKLK